MSRRMNPKQKASWPNKTEPTLSAQRPLSVRHLFFWERRVDATKALRAEKDAEIAELRVRLAMLEPLVLQLRKNQSEYGSNGQSARTKPNGNPANGEFDFEFQLWKC